MADNKGIKFIMYLIEGSQVKVQFEDTSTIEDVYRLLNEDIHDFIKVGKTQIVHKNSIARVKVVEGEEGEVEPVNNLTTKVKPKDHPNLPLFGKK